MANIKIAFLTTIDEDSSQLECFNNQRNEITISITDTDADHAWGKQLVSLDVPTAIKLAKTLRAEINKAKEVYNG